MKSSILNGRFNSIDVLEIALKTLLDDNVISRNPAIIDQCVAQYASGVDVTRAACSLGKKVTEVVPDIESRDCLTKPEATQILQECYLMRLPTPITEEEGTQVLGHNLFTLYLQP